MTYSFLRDAAHWILRFIVRTFLFSSSSSSFYQGKYFFFFVLFKFMFIFGITKLHACVILVIYLFTILSNSFVFPILLISLVCMSFTSSCLFISSLKTVQFTFFVL